MRDPASPCYYRTAIQKLSKPPKPAGAFLLQGASLMDETNWLRQTAVEDDLLGRLNAARTHYQDVMTLSPAERGAQAEARTEYCDALLAFTDFINRMRPWIYQPHVRT
jgi:hypothetical protein